MSRLVKNFADNSYYFQSRTQSPLTNVTVDSVQVIVSLTEVLSANNQLQSHLHLQLPQIKPFVKTKTVEATSIFHFEQHTVLNKSDVIKQLMTECEVEDDVISTPESREIVFKSFSSLHNNNDLITSVADRLLSSSNIVPLYEYPVPSTNKEESSSVLLSFNLAVQAYHLMSHFDSSVLALPHPMTQRLRGLNNVVNLLYSHTLADWVGIYRIMQSDGDIVLVKEAYIGEPSQAVVIVSDVTAQSMTNSWVALNGRVRNVMLHSHTCNESTSTREQSVLCVPILHQNSSSTVWEVVGVVELKSLRSEHFTPQLVADVVQVAMYLGEASHFLVLPSTV